MKFLIMMIVAFAAAILMTTVLKSEPGYVVLALETHVIRVNLMVFVLMVLVFFAVTYLLVNMIVNLFRAPKKLRTVKERNNEKKAQAETMQGYANLIEGNWSGAESSLLNKIEHNKSPLLNFLGAAYAAQQQGRFDKRDEYLQRALKAHPKHKFAILLTRARLLIQVQEFVRARDLLERMHKAQRKNVPVTRLLADTYQRLEQWDDLSKLLPSLASQKALSPLEQTTREQLAFGNQLLLSHEQGASQLINTWKHLPAKAHKDPHVVSGFAKMLISLGEMGYAEGVIRKVLHKTWDTELVYWYGRAEAMSVDDQIQIAENWAIYHNNDANLMLTLARLYRRAGRLQEAREQYQKAISSGGSEEACTELGSLLEQLGETESALLCYKRGMSAISRHKHDQGVSTDSDNVKALNSPDDGKDDTDVMPVIR